MQLYKYMDIGSAKPTKEELETVSHWLINQIDPREVFSVVKYQKLAIAAIRDIFSRGKTPVVTGGTGLYLNSLLYKMDFGPTQTDFTYRKSLETIYKNNGAKVLHEKLEKVDPEGAKRIHPNNVKRVIRALEAIEQGGESLNDFNKVKIKTKDYDSLLLGLCRDREELYQRINTRVMDLIDKGLLLEVENLMKQGFTYDDIAMKGIGYKEIISYYNGSYDLNTAIETVQKNTRHYAKRQMTWFNRYQDLKWFNLTHYNSKKEALKDIIEWIRKNK